MFNLITLVHIWQTDSPVSSYEFPNPVRLIQESLKRLLEEWSFYYRFLLTFVK